jgi:hypothetical protein
VINRTNVVAEVGSALRASLAASLQDVDHPAGTPQPGVQLKLLRLAASPVLRGHPIAHAQGPGEPLPALELEYIAWIDGTETEAEERLIGAVLAWLHASPLQSVEGLGEGSGPVATWQVRLTPVALDREELLRLWNVPAFAGRALLAFEARVSPRSA